MEHSIQIPNPCPESWDTMTPEGNGRHCTKCSKTVTDFTEWEQKDIVAYTRTNNATGVCGRFRAEQLDTIEVDRFVHAVSYSRLSLSRSIAAILLAAIGFITVSCNTSNPPPAQTQRSVTGAITFPTPPPPTSSSTLHTDTAEVVEKTGEVIMRPVTKNIKHRNTLPEAPPIVVPEDPRDRYIMGVPPHPPELMPADTSKPVK